MALLEIKPMFYTKQVKETVDFYTGVLGFTCESYTDDWSWAALARGSVEIMEAYPMRICLLKSRRLQVRYTY